MCQGNGEVTGVHPFVLLFSGKIDCTFKTIVKVCGCCDKPYIDYPESFYSGNRFLLPAFSEEHYVKKYLT